jgi:hypothetical protein
LVCIDSQSAFVSASEIRPPLYLDLIHERLESAGVEFSDAS